MTGGDFTAWYHWIAVYAIIAGGVIFTIFPYKPWWLWLCLLLLIAIGLLMGVFLPHKEDKYVDK